MMRSEPYYGKAAFILPKYFIFIAIRSKNWGKLIKMLNFKWFYYDAMQRGSHDER